MSSAFREDQAKLDDSGKYNQLNSNFALFGVIQSMGETARVNESHNSFNRNERNGGDDTKEMSQRSNLL